MRKFETFLCENKFLVNVKKLFWNILFKNTHTCSNRHDNMVTKVLITPTYFYNFDIKYALDYIYCLLDSYIKHILNPVLI